MSQRVAILLLLMVLGVGSVHAQTSTPTNTPTPTATPTATATLNLYQFVTVIAPGGGDPQAGVIKYEVNAGDVMIALLLFALVVLSIVRLVVRFRRGQE